MIAIIDYGAGNLRSAYNALRALGADVEIVACPDRLMDADGIVLPGVGAFGDCMGSIVRSGFVQALDREVIVRKKPYLGICIGMQLLADKGFEHGEHKGLGWISGVCDMIRPGSPDFKIPHMGWNEIQVEKDSGILKGLGRSPVFYFVHSYCFRPDESEVVTSTCLHGELLVSSIRKENIYGVQFHPEKSQAAGLTVLRNFMDIVDGDKHA